MHFILMQLFFQSDLESNGVDDDDTDDDGDDVEV